MPYPIYDRWKPIVIRVSAWILAISASMILGLLSFSGMLAICPALSLAYAAFLFAIVIEGEIYLQNILSALFKLTDPKVYENQLTALYIVEKLVDFDKNRDLFLMREPNEEDKKQVCEHNQVVLFRKEGQAEIGFRNPHGEYQQEKVVEDQSRFLNHYSHEAEFMEIPGHHAHIQAILKQLHPRLPDRPQLEYPFFMKAYVSQCQYVRSLNCYSHTRPDKEIHQEELAAMTAHLDRLDKDVSELLFRDAPVQVGQTELQYFTFPCPYTQKSYDLYFKTMTLEFTPLIRGLTIAKKNNSKSTFLDTVKSLPENHPLLVKLSKQTYDFHHRKLDQWISGDRAAWKQKLATHTLYSRLALLVSALSGLVMGIGTTYLIMESIAAIPWLAALPLGLFPPMIGPLALIVGIAYGLLIYNSLTDILLDNPFKKFLERLRANSHNIDLKKGLMLGLTLVLFLVTVFLAICAAGTWLTVFHKTKPLFTWISHIPNVLLNVIIPVLIGISMLPFSIQSITNTLENLEGNPTVDRMVAALNPANWRAPTWRFPRTFAEASTAVSDAVWKKWVPDFLGVTKEEFAHETSMQQRNPYRIIYRLFFEPLRALIFIGHLISVGATSDQIEGVPVIVSFILNFLFECAEDWDWIWGREHVDNLNTVDLLKERAQKSDDHNHDKNIPMRILKFVFEPVLKRAAQWDNEHRCANDEDNLNMSYERIRSGNQYKAQEAAAPKVPSYRKQGDFNLFLFKSGTYEASSPLPDNCCIKLPAV